ncbi:hypothetical protein J2W56_004981 [Nocardia kruczakiae]|uniref:PPE domain-containing protein n=1 Tax=Nocardia kruczakiae TaxID=261477 RepID=A0ABU1XMM5_9NOCA|nr:hypothetical protein [Nocardia kruczakiae]MDR7171222.1 hypothetical protein [Nocardia kruczakiae]
MGTDNQPDPGAAILTPLLGINVREIEDRKSANQAQRGAQQVQQGIHHQSTDPSYIKDLEFWESLDHQSIYLMVNGIKPDVMHDHAKSWHNIAAALGGGLFGLNISIQKELSDGFHGQFAGAAADAAKKFVQQATDVQEVITTVGARITAAAYGAEAAKLAVPPPDTTSAPAINMADVLTVALGAAPPAPTIDKGKADAEKRQQAIDAMHNNYDPTYRPAGDGVPTFVPVDAPGGDGTNSPNSRLSNSGNGINHSGNPSGPNSEGDEHKPGDSTEKSDPDASQKTDPASASQFGQSSNQPGSQNPSTPATSSLPGSDTRPSGFDSTNAAGYGGGGPGSGVGSYGTHGGSSGAQSGGPGRSIPGVSGGGNSAAASAFGARPGQPGLGGMPGMGGMGGAGKKDESEREHKTPDYLIMDREEELLGRRERTLPEAIGADAPAAQFRPDDEGHQR